MRLSPETSTKPIYASDIRALQDRNIEVFACCNEHQHLNWLIESGVCGVCSHLNGEQMDEDAVIRECLLREREVQL